MNDRDANIIRHIRRYCDEVGAAVERFGDDRDSFMNDPVYRNAVAMPVQQIGELAKHLSDGFLEERQVISKKPNIRTRFPE